MGFEIFKRATGKDWQHPSEIPMEVFEANRGHLPEFMTGQEFLGTHDGVDDPMSAIEPDTRYAVRDSLRFPIEEHDRTTRSADRLRTAHGADETLQALGQALHESHQGYNRIGLGHPVTDEMVALVRSLGPGKGCYGARVSGGGCGGTVVVLMREASLDLFESTRHAHMDQPWSKTGLILSRRA